MGYFNRKKIKWDSLTSTTGYDNAFIESVRDSYLTQHIKSPTIGRGNDEPSTLDLLFTSQDDTVEKLEIHSPLGKSDHSMIQLSYL